MRILNNVLFRMLYNSHNNSHIKLCKKKLLPLHSAPPLRCKLTLNNILFEQQAAGIFSYMKGNIMMAVHQETTPDLNPDTLHALSQLMLAQAQEVIAYKCIRGIYIFLPCTGVWTFFLCSDLLCVRLECFSML